MAQQTGVDPRVKAFAGHMVNDHSAMLEQGAQLSNAHMILPVQPDIGQTLVRDHMATLDSLKAKSGKEFDRAYIAHEITMHQKVLSLVEEASRSANNPALKHLLQQTQPVLERHLMSAQDVQQSLRSAS